MQQWTSLLLSRSQYTKILYTRLKQFLFIFITGTWTCAVVAGYKKLGFPNEDSKNIDVLIEKIENSPESKLFFQNSKKSD